MDRALALLDSSTDREAASRFGFGRNVVTVWRYRRRRGEPILNVQAANREALERLFDGRSRSDRIPIP